MDLPNRGDLRCKLCAWECPMEDFAASFEIVTESAPRAPPAWIMQEDMREDDVNKRRARVDEACQKCNHEWTYFYTMQMRSADEGQTVFYECPKCSHRWSQNN